MSTAARLRQLALAAGLAALTLTATRAAAGVDGAGPPTGQLWAAVEGDTYEQRAHFAKGVERMSARLDEQIRQLKARRAAMTSDTKDWDFAMKEVAESRVLLTGRISDLAAAATPESWADAKEKVGEAWKRSQIAVDNMKSTRTT